MPIQWNDEPLPDAVLLSMHSWVETESPVVPAHLLCRAVQEIRRLQLQVGTLRMDRRELFAERGEAIRRELKLEERLAEQAAKIERLQSPLGSGWWSSRESL